MKNLLFLGIFLIVSTCAREANPGWQKVALTDDTGKPTGATGLQVKGTDLSRGLTEATLTYSVIEDLISGGVKEIFAITLNGKSYSSPVIFVTNDKVEHKFECYDGYIFNINEQSNDIEEIKTLMQNEWLTIQQEKYHFSINTKGFMDEL